MTSKHICICVCITCIAFEGQLTVFDFLKNLNELLLDLRWYNVLDQDVGRPSLISFAVASMQLGCLLASGM